MTALQRLQEKIEQWRGDHEALKMENEALKTELNASTSVQGENSNKIESLQIELNEKDKEIEKIIAQVEALLS